MHSPLNEAAAVPAALSAFLRGVERRGALFAELQCGDRDAGDTALAAALRAFRNHAGELAMAEWPRRFWSLLVSAPPLRQAAPLARWPPALRSLAPLGSGARRALLLRLVAGLPEEEAALVLGLDPAAYQQALTDACPRDADGQPDALAWRSLAEAIQQQLRDLPPDRLARLARLREEAIAGTRHERPRAGTTTAAAAKPAAASVHRRWPWVVLVLGACVLALAATWWWPRWQGSAATGSVLEQGVQRLQDEVEIRSEELPEQAPAARFDATTALLTHPDFELVMDAQEEALARDADFNAWYAAGADAVVEDAKPATESPAAEKTDATETSDAQL
ncbi:MAG: hypothetical protein ACREO7_00705 [Pseudoxanthomonas sp.]